MLKMKVFTPRKLATEDTYDKRSLVTTNIALTTKKLFMIYIVNYYVVNNISYYYSRNN